MIRKIKDPIFPNKDVTAVKKLLPKIPPKLLLKYKSAIEQMHVIKKRELAILTNTLMSELYGSS